jgi:hypothetical protein
MSMYTKYRLKPNVVVHDCPWIESGGVYEGAIVNTFPPKVGREVKLLKPDDEVGFCVLPLRFVEEVVER